jgi:hypothetical protein
MGPLVVSRGGFTTAGERVQGNRPLRGIEIVPLEEEDVTVGHANMS